MLGEDLSLRFSTLTFSELLKTAAESCFSSALKQSHDNRKRIGHGSNFSLIFSDLILNRTGPDNSKEAVEQVRNLLVP